VVVYCHSNVTVLAQFLFRAQDRNMTNGDFAFFTFQARRSSSTDRLWIQYGSSVDNADDLPRRQRAFDVVKQVIAFIRRPFVKLSYLKYDREIDKKRRKDWMAEGLVRRLLILVEVISKARLFPAI